VSKFRKHKDKTFIRQVLDEKKRASVNEPRRLENFQISLQYYIDDKPEPHTLETWQEKHILADALKVLAGYCKRPLREQIDGDKFAVYNGFPPPDKTEFEYPGNVPEDAHWARIHVKGEPVIVGHIVGNTFFIVFLDREHRFWLTKRELEN